MTEYNAESYDMSLEQVLNIFKKEKKLNLLILYSGSCEIFKAEIIHAHRDIKNQGKCT